MMQPERAVGERRQINLVELGRPGRGWHGQCKFQPTVLAMLNAAMHADRAILLDWQGLCRPALRAKPVRPARPTGGLGSASVLEVLSQ